MSFHKVFAICSIFGLLAAPVAFANPVSSAAQESSGGNAAPVTSAAYEPNDAPIVSGRSVMTRHKSKMHHVRIKPDDALDADTPGKAAD